MNKRVMTLAGATAATLQLVMPAVAAAGAAAQSPCAAVPEGVALLVPDGAEVGVARATGYQPITGSLPQSPAVAARAFDGTVWVEAPLDGGFSDVLRLAVGSAPVGSVRGEVELSSIGSLGGRAAAVIVDHAHPQEVEEYGRVLVEFANGEQVDVKIAGAPEYGVVSATLGAERLVEGAWADLTEAFQYYGLDGEPLDDWFDPTDSAPYAEPPLFQWPVASGTTLSWIEGPDFPGASNEPVGDWQLVLADTVTGDEKARVGLGRAIGAQLLHADFDGRFWVGSFEPGGVIIVDTTAPQPAAIDARCVAGTVATIDRFGVASPPVCPTYEPNDRYPIRLCDEGMAVSAIQRALVAAGHQLEVDGYFGPLTEQEVRRFQQAHGLEVDGLVGDDTWPALMALAQPAGTDADGSGIIDPWELNTAPA
jgi:hypothetical protein